DGTEQAPNLVDGQHERNPHGPAGAHRIKVSDLLAKHVAIEKQQRSQRLILSAGRHTAVDGQVSEKGLDLRRSHGVRMADAVESNVSLRPMDVALFGAGGEMLDAGDLADLIEQLHDRLRSVCTLAGALGRRSRVFDPKPSCSA